MIFSLLAKASKSFNSKFLFSVIFISAIYVGIYKSNFSLLIVLTATTILSSTITRWGIPKLNQLRANQIIRNEGPKQHLSKSGTPTMGGLLIIPIGVVTSILVALNQELDKKLIYLSFLILSFMIIGFLDDWKSLINKRNDGLSPKTKLVLETICGGLFVQMAWANKLIDSQISFPFGITYQMGLMILPLAIFSILAESNATNLTDGLDGLASGCGALIFAGLAFSMIIQGNVENTNLAIFAMGMSGSWLGFLIHNKNPAKIFMGDTGSLPMGAALAGIGLLGEALWPLFVMSGIFFLESLSVIIQVSIFKLTKIYSGKGYRVFLMTPIHHHFEISGNKEESIVQGFWLSCLILVIISLLLLP